MKISTHISRFLLIAFIGSLAFGLSSCGPTRGYVEQDFNNGLTGGLYYNGYAPSPRPPKPPRAPKPPKHHKAPKPPKPPKKHKGNKHDKRHGHGKPDRNHNNGHRPH